MAKQLTMAEIDTILTLHNAGHSNREIAALVG
jgi:IS30 family transposase